jgi:hypothetical protein
VIRTTETEDFNAWIADLEKRHLSDLTFQEVSRSLRALSSTYVERRQRLAEGAALAGAGKRAAFALFYGPLHYLLVREIVSALPGATADALPLVDLGCGTGASGSAWARMHPVAPRVVGIDRNAWAVREAAATYRAFHVSARVTAADVSKVAMPPGRASFLAAFTLNELENEARDRLLSQLVERASAGDRLLVVEPLAGFVAPWWNRWKRIVEEAGGRADEWRFRVALPAIVAKLDRASGLNHQELRARSLWLSP